MPTLHLGVLDIPYSSAPPKHRRRGAGVASGTQTTGDVAGWLEDRYNVMGVFYEENAQMVADALAESVQGALETMLVGGPVAADPYAGATGKIEDRFKEALSLKELEGIMPGTPTGAAMRGVNHRMKRPYVKRPPRPSFIDTGLYQASFKSWVD